MTVPIKKVHRIQDDYYEEKQFLRKIVLATTEVAASALLRELEKYLNKKLDKPVK